MRTVISIFFFLLISNFLFGQTTYKVLFIGNSYTASNNLPQVIKDVSQSTGDDIIFSTSTPGGYRFLNHAVYSGTLNAIKSNQWDYVTLQAQSQEPSWPQGQVQNDVFPYAAQLCDSIRSNNGCTKPVFFMTWGRENGDASNCGTWPPVCTYDGMDSILSQNYQIMAQDNKALVSPVGTVWNYIRTNFPAIDLYSSDGSHPSQRGSYAAAVTFYTIFFKKDPTFITYDYVLGNAEASNIRNAVKAIVYDSLSRWNVDRFNPISDNDLAGCDSIEISGNWLFTDTIFSDTLISQSEFGCDSIANYSVVFQQNESVQIDTSIQVGNILQFGSFSISDSGQYQLIFTNNIGCDSIVNLNVVLITTGVNEKLFNQISFSPNPAEDFILINNQSNKVLAVKIISITGVETASFIIDKPIYKISLEKYSKGIYLLKISSDSETVIKKMLIR